MLTRTYLIFFSQLLENNFPFLYAFPVYLLDVFVLFCFLIQKLFDLIEFNIIK